MVVVNINDIREVWLGSDMTLSETETVDSTSVGDNFNIISIYPRKYEEVVDVNIYDVYRDKEVDLECYAVIKDRGRQDIYIEFDFKDENEYLINVSNSNILIWRGKALATDQTDLQNYTTIEESQNGIIKI
jgi:hypothetical protein